MYEFNTPKRTKKEKGVGHPLSCIKKYVRALQKRDQGSAISGQRK